MSLALIVGYNKPSVQKSQLVGIEKMTTHTVNTQVAGKIVRTNEEGRRYQFFGFGKGDLDLVSHHTKNSAVIYILLNGGFKPTYVGQCANGFSRIKNHLTEDIKEFESVIAFTIPQQKYLNAVESAFIGSFGGLNLHNKTVGNKPKIDEFEQNYINDEMSLIKFMFGQTYTAFMNVSQEFSFVGLMAGFNTTPAKVEEFDEFVEEQLPIGEFKHSEIQVAESAGVSFDDANFIFTFCGHKVIGAHTQGDDSFEVFKGSTARLETTKSYSGVTTGAKTLRANLINQGILQHDEQTNQYVFTDDFVFDSIAQAGTICYAGTLNAPKAFIKEDTKIPHQEYYQQIVIKKGAYKKVPKN